MKRRRTEEEENSSGAGPAEANNKTSCCMKKRRRKSNEGRSEQTQRTCRGACTVLCMLVSRFSTHQTSVENVKQSLRRNHVGLRKDYNTIYLEKHNVTPGDVTWDSWTSKSLRSARRRREAGRAGFANARPERHGPLDPGWVWCEAGAPARISQTC